MQRQVLIDGLEVGVIDFDTLECLDCNEQALQELVDQAADEGFPVTVDADAGSIHYTELSEENIGQFEKFLADRGYTLGDEVELDPEREDPEYEEVDGDEISAGGEDTQAVTGTGKVRDARIVGAVTVAGFNIVIEHKAGEERYGKSLPADYGYIRRTGSAEGQDVQMDCFVRDPETGGIFIVDSYKPDTGEFDEHKIMIGYANETAALADFHEYYSGGIGLSSNFWQLKAPDKRFGVASTVTQYGLSAWLDAGDLKQPYAPRVDVQYTATASSETERCQACTFFNHGACSNPRTAKDPKVPGGIGGKFVAPSGWCTEFTKSNVDTGE